MLEHKKEHLVRDFLQFSHCVASKCFLSHSKSTFSHLFLWTLKFVPGFRQFSAHLTKYHACHGICTVSPLRPALTMRFAKNTQHDTSKVLRLPRKITMMVSKVLRLPRKMQRIFGFSTRYETRLNVTTKCHACHAKQSNVTFETSKSNAFCRTYYRHGHTGPHADGCGRLPTAADGCERLRP